MVSLSTGAWCIECAFDAPPITISTLGRALELISHMRRLQGISYCDKVDSQRHNECSSHIPREEDAWIRRTLL